MGRPHTCPYCGQRNSISKGVRRNRAGSVRLRRCKDCGRRWTVQDSLAAADAIPKTDAVENSDEAPVSAESRPEVTAEFVSADRLLPHRDEESSRYVAEEKPEP